MKRLFCTLTVCLLPCLAIAQPPGPPGPRGGQDRGPNPSPLQKLMQYDQDGDGVLTRSELSDRRLQALFARADSDKDDRLTQAEIEAVVGSARNGGRGRGGRGREFGERPGFEGGPPPGRPQFGRGPGREFPGPGSFQPPRPGTILPDHLIEMMGLTTEQRQQLKELQEKVDARLAKILTDEQLEQFRRGPERGRGPGPGMRQGRGFRGGREGGRPPSE